MNKQELINQTKKQCGGSVALQQALRSLGYSYQAVAEFVGVSKRTVWQNCNGVHGCFTWEQRIGKADLQRFAKQLVKELKKMEEPKMRSIEEIAASLQTSEEIIEAIIVCFNCESEEQILKIWQDPSEEESQKILEYAWNKTDYFELFWGIEKIFRDGGK